MTRRKPRKSSKALEAKPAEFVTIEIDNPTKLPEHYLVVADGWIGRVALWDERLRVRSLAVKKPLTLYVLTRQFGCRPELCLETESLAPAAPAGVVTAKGSMKNPDKEERALLKSLRQDPAKMVEETLEKVAQ